MKTTLVSFFFVLMSYIGYSQSGYGSLYVYCDGVSMSAHVTIIGSSIYGSEYWSSSPDIRYSYSENSIKVTDTISKTKIIDYLNKELNYNKEHLDYVNKYGWTTFGTGKEIKRTNKHIDAIECEIDKINNTNDTTHLTYGDYYSIKSRISNTVYSTKSKNKDDNYDDVYYTKHK